MATKKKSKKPARRGGKKAKPVKRKISRKKAAPKKKAVRTKPKRKPVAKRKAAPKKAKTVKRKAAKKPVRKTAKKVVKKVAKKKPAPKPKAVPAKQAPAPASVVVERREEVYSTPSETLVVETVVVTETETAEGSLVAEEQVVNNTNEGNNGTTIM
ncbi:MAG: hypothetical protein ACT4OJ_14370 [Bacteroidota bacterium]